MNKELLALAETSGTLVVSPSVLVQLESDPATSTLLSFRFDSNGSPRRKLMRADLFVNKEYRPGEWLFMENKIEGVIDEQSGSK